MKVVQMVSVLLPLLLSLILLYRTLEFFERNVELFQMNKRHGYYSLIALIVMTLGKVFLQN